MKKIILIIILTIGLFLRVYKLGSYPTGFLWDEAALGYNAYSILHTGKDEYGNRLPIIFKSFGDYKPGFYVYTAIPFIALFGLNEFSTRLPSALAGTIAIYLLYLLINKKSGDERLALLSAFVLCINPWHLNFSRGSWELNLMLTEILAMLWYLDHYLITKSHKSGCLALFFFTLSLFTYQSAKLISPILVVLYLIINLNLRFDLITINKIRALSLREFLKKLLKIQTVAFVSAVALVFATVTLFTVVGGKGGRLKVMSLFSYPRLPEETGMILNQDNQNQTLYSIFHSAPVFFTRSILGRYFNHFSGRFLFIDGDWQNPRLGVIYHGLFYLVDLFFMTLGLIALTRKGLKPIDRFMLVWLLLAPLPAALSRDSVSSVRSFTMVIPLVYLIANGINWFVSSIKYRVSRISCFYTTNTKYLITNISIQFCYLLFVLCYLLSFIRFADLYLLHNPRLIAKDRLYGYRQAVEAIIQKGKAKDKIIFSPKYGQPYIFYLFYTAYNPALYQQQALLKENPYGDVGDIEKLNTIEFRQIYWPSDRGIGNSLFIGTDEELPLKDITSEPEKFIVDREINYPDGKVAFRIVETY